MVTSSEYLKQAQNYLKTNKIKDAESSLQQAIDLDHSNIDAQITLAKLLLDSNKLKYIDRMIEGILKVSPDNLETLNIKWQSLIARSQPTAAIEVLHHIIEIDPKQIAPYLELAKVLKTVEKFDEAEALLRKTLITHPRSSEAKLELALVLILNGKDDEAMRLLMQLNKLKTSSSVSYIELAQLYRRKKRFDDAIKICNQFIKNNPQAFDVAFLLKDIYWEQGDTLAAINTMNDICNERGTTEDFLALGDIAYNTKEYDMAQRSYKWAGTLAPETWQPHVKLAELYASLDKNDLAEEEYKSAIKLNSNSYEPHNSLAMYFVKQDQIDKALKHLEHACKLAPTEAIPLYNFGLLLLKTGRFEEARESLAIAYENSSSETLTNKIAKVLSEVDKELGIK